VLCCFCCVVFLYCCFAVFVTFLLCLLENTFKILDTSDVLVFFFVYVFLCLSVQFYLQYLSESVSGSCPIMIC